MIRALVNFLLGLRKIFQRWGVAIADKFRDEESGKFRAVSPKNLKKIFLVLVFTFFFSLVLMQIFGGKQPISGGLEDYKKEIEPKLTVGEREQNYPAISGDDPLSALNNRRGAADPLEALRGGGGAGSGTATGDEQAGPSYSDCMDLVEKLKTGVPLSTEESATAQECVDKNIAQLSAAELALVKQLLRTDLTPEERELLAKKLAGDTDDDSLEGRIANAMADAAKRGDQAALEAARAALAALTQKNEELAQALLKQATNETLTPNEQKLLAEFQRLMGANAAGGSPAAGARSNEEGARLLAQSIADREAALRALQQELAAAQAAAAAAGRKVEGGQKLSPAEQAALQRLLELQKQQEALRQQQEREKAALARLMDQLKKTLAQVSVTMERTFPSGVSVALKDSLVDCQEVKPLVAKRPRKPGKPAPKKDVVLGLDGQPLTPDQIRLVQLFRRKKSEDAKNRDQITNPLGNSVGEKMDMSLLPEGSTIEVAALTVYSNKSQKRFNLTPDMKIPAVLESQILISDKGGNQSVRVRIVDDIYNPENNELVIPKGSIAIAQTSGFDADTGVMDLNFDKVTVGAGKVETVKLRIGSADGTMGLKGQVRDNRGKFLLGAFVTSFSAGALNWFSQAVIQDYVDDTATTNGLIGAGLQGGSEVMNRIAEMYAGDLQNAAKIFFVPKSIPVVLFPE